MQKLALFSFLIASTSVLANELTSYNAIKSAVVEGKSIRIAIDFDKCMTQQKMEKHTTSFGLGIFTPNEIIITSNGGIAASMLHFTMSDPHMPGTPVYQFVRYTITPDNTITLFTQALNASNFTPLSDGFSFNCKVNASAKVYE